MPQFTNQAQLAYQTTEINSNVVTGEVLETLSVTKSTVTTAYGQNTDISYVINIINNGLTPYTDLTVTDDLGAYTFGAQTLRPEEYVPGTMLYYQNGVLQPNPSVTSLAPLVINGVSVPAQGNTQIIYTAKTNGYAPLGENAEILNTVTVNNGYGAGDIRALMPLTDEISVPAMSGLSLTIAKSAVPVTVTQNGTLTYSFVILNTGSAAATEADLVTVRDVFSPILRDISVTFNGAAWVANTNYNYDEATGQFSTVPGQITVPAATYVQDAATGLWQTVPGSATLLVSGEI